MIKHILKMMLFLSFATVVFADPINAPLSETGASTAAAQSATVAAPAPTVAPPQDLMSVKVSIPNESNAAFQAALPKAFAQVLVNVTGDPGVMQNPAVANQKPNLSSFVQNYSVVRENGSQGNQELFVQITFDKTAVDSFLQQAGFHVDAAQPVRIEILSINSLQDYLEALKAIKALPGIKHVFVADTNGTSLILSVEINGGSQNLAKILSQTQNFVASNPDARDGSVDLYYRWQRSA